MIKEKLRCSILLLFFALIALLGVNFITQFSPTTETSYSLERIEAFDKDMQYINDNFADDYESRLIVKSEGAVSDTNAVASAIDEKFSVFQYASVSDALQGKTRFEANPAVTKVYFDSQVQVEEDMLGEAQVASEHMTWGAELLGVDNYQNYLKSIYGSVSNMPKVYIAVLDTGIDTDHEFLKGRIAYEYGQAYYRSTVSSQYAFEDDVRHGTHVAGVIADLTPSNVSIIPIKILGKDGSGSLANILSAINKCIELKQSGVNIVAMNMSLSGYGQSSDIAQYIHEAYKNNIITVVAAGNSNYYVETEYPANVEEALTIGALENNPYYSNFPNVAYFSNFGRYIDLSLPGADILSCVPDFVTGYDVQVSQSGGKYMSMSGTSMATPHASALCALYATRFGSDYQIANIENAIKENVLDFGDVGKDDIFGYGVPTMDFAYDEYILDSEPQLNYGELNSTYYSEQDSLKIMITNTNPRISDYNYEIYYTLDGTYPTMDNGQLYSQGIEIKQSALLRFKIYLTDSTDKMFGDSELYEVTYYLGGQTANDTGIGFTIDSRGLLTSYKSGLKDIVIPQEINGQKVTGLAGGLFYGLNISSFTCDFDLQIGTYPFSRCSSLKTVRLSSKQADRLLSYCFALEELDLPAAHSILEGKTQSNYDDGYYGSYTFLGCFNLTSLSVPSIATLPRYSLSGFQMLENLITNNLTTIADCALENCTNLEGGDFENVLQIGQGAFMGSGLKHIRTNATTVQNYAFANCFNLKSAVLPQISTLGGDVFNGSILEYVLLGPSLKSLTSSSLTNDFSFKIYCYDTSFIKKYTNFSAISLVPTLQENNSGDISATFLGFDVSLELSLDGRVLDTKFYEGVAYQEKYTFSKLFQGSHTYTLKLTDHFGNERKIEIEKTHKNTSPHFVIINSNISLCGVVCDSECYYSGEQVTITNQDIDGYVLVSVMKDGQSIEFVDGKYIFVMGDEDVNIEVEYRPQYFNLSLSIIGEGQAKIFDANGNEINQSEAGAVVSINFEEANIYYIKEIYYYLGTQKVNINFDNGRADFVMPAQNILIYLRFEKGDIASEFEYAIMQSDGRIGLVKYKGNKVDVVIPQFYYLNGERYQISHILENCFSDSRQIHSVSMTITEEEGQYMQIRSGAFEDCLSLESVSLGKITKIDSRAFANCTKLQEIDLSHATQISSSAFEYCQKLKSIDISSCTLLGSYAFYNCTALENAIIGASAISSNCFEGCTNLKQIDLSRVSTIGNYAFWDCQSLTIVDLSNIKSFGTRAIPFAKKVYLGNNKNLIPSSDLTNLSPFIRNIYIARDYDGEISDFIKGFTFVNHTDKYTIYSLYQPFAIKFKLSNGELIDEDYCDSSTPIEVPIVYNNGEFTYEIMSWIKEGDEASEVLPSEITFATEDITYIAKSVISKKNIYQIRFYYGYDYDESGQVGDDGDIALTFHLGYQERIVFSQLTRESTGEFNYKNNGWLYNGELVIEELRVTGDMDFVASWTFEKRKYTITWLDGDENILYQETLEYGEMPQYSAEKGGTPTKTSSEPYNYVYVYNGQWEGLTAVNGDATYIAPFTLEHLIYKINYIFNIDKNTTKTVSVETRFGKKFSIGVPEPTSYEFSGVRYTFVGWDIELGDSLDKEDLQYFTNSREIDINARYIESRIEYIVTWADDKGQVIYTQKYYYNDIPVYNFAHYGTPTKQSDNFYDYQFDSENPWLPAVQPVTSNITYNAHFIAIQRLYDIYWRNEDGTLIYTERLGYGEPLAYRDEYMLPTKDDDELFYYEFVAWENYTPTVEGEVSLFPIFYRFNKFTGSTDGVVDLSELNFTESRVKLSDVALDLNVKFADIEFYIPSSLVQYLKYENKSLLISYSKCLSEELTNAVEFDIKFYVSDGAVDEEIGLLNEAIKIVFKNLTNLNATTSVVRASGTGRFEINANVASDSVTIDTRNIGRFIIGQRNDGKTLEIMIGIAFLLVVIIVISAAIVIRRRIKLSKYK